jgi:hypothetical protein
MKRKNMTKVCATLLVGLSLGATVAYAGMLAGTGIVGSKHDMNRLSSSDPYQRVCAYCHTPHHAITEGNDYLPLWSHELTAQSFSMYASPTLDAQYEADPLMGPSRLCMSCHDGVVAVDQHYNISGGVQKTGDNYGQIAITNGTGDLTNDHPIGFNFADVAAADRGIRPPDSTFIDNPTGLTIQDALYSDGIMTCATCHEVHNRDNVSQNPAYNYFIYSPEENSKICLSCHDK